MKVNNIQNFQSEDVKNTWDTIWDNYSQAGCNKSNQISLDYEAIFKKLKEIIGDIANINILEAGSGSGVISAQLSRNGANTTLLDYSKNALITSQKYFLENNIIGAKFVEGNILELPFKDNTFDVVWNAGVIEHFLDEGKKTVIKEMFRVTKQGGKVIIIFPYCWSFPYFVVKPLLIFLKKWVFGFEDNISIKKSKKITSSLQAKKITMFKFNPIISWWMLPYGRKTTDWLKLNTLEKHTQNSYFGHLTVVVLEK